MSDQKPQNKPDKDKGGRPWKYKPEYDEMLLKHMSEGFPYKTFGAVVGVCEDTLFNWEKHYPSFLEAKKRGVLAGELHWFKIGKDNILNVSESSGSGEDSYRKSTSLNGSTWQFIMKNQYKYYDKNPDQVDKVLNLNKDVSELSDEELKKALDEKLKKLQGNE